ncbi:hypothetical protein [Pseudomonas sp. NA-150]|uniref:hypothetical protein n=1 Tax=Pseudomonas sp. NA-150 TaxID=3367525 RepID=UPI0037C83FA5
MNNETIDRLLIRLLRTPEDERTQEHVVEALALVREAANLEATSQDEPFKEQLKLAAIAELLTSELNMSNFSVSLDMRGLGVHRIQSLSLSMTGSDKTWFFGYGKTAEEALKDLHEHKPKAECSA